MRGANIPAMLRAMVACGWFGIQTWIGGLALDALVRAAWPGWTEVPGNTAIAFLAFWLIQVAVILKGIEGISFCHFTEVDVVRHPLVQQIIKAYDRTKGPAGGGFGPPAAP